MLKEFKGLALDNFQSQSMEILSNNNSVIVSAPTGSGKTLIIEYAIEKLLLDENREFLNQKKIIYTSPIKALSNQKYRDWYGLQKLNNNPVYLRPSVWLRQPLLHRV